MSRSAKQIREKQQRLLQLDSEAQRLRAELNEARAAFFEVPTATVAVARKHLPGRPGNSTEWALEVLRQAQRPMHANEIVEAIERMFMAEVQVATLVGNLSRLIKKGKLFERVGPNTFGLIEWAVAREADELFGRDELESERGLDTRSSRIS